MTDLAAPGTARPPRRRVAMWDTARFLSVTLVVIGHAIQRLITDSDLALGVYLFVYAWHMPAFAIISGYFSRSGPPTTVQMRRVVTDILIPYLIMESLWTIVKITVEGSRTIDPTTPSWTLWFLLALAIFRIVLPYLALLRWPLLFAVAASIGVGYLENIDHTFSLARAIGILPFFVLGWRMRQWRLVRRWLDGDIPRWPWRLVAIVAVLAWVAAVWGGLDLWRAIGLQYWFFYDRAYEILGSAEWWSWFARLGVLALGALLALAFLALVPNRRLWVTRFGRSTMYIYLLHSFVLYPIRESGVLQGTGVPELLLVIMIALGVVISIVLGTRIVRAVFRPLIEPRVDWLFRDRPTAGRGRRDPTGARRNP